MTVHNRCGIFLFSWAISFGSGVPNSSIGQGTVLPLQEIATDSIALDSPWTTYQVRTVAPDTLVASWWSDSTWVYQGPCTGATQVFRIETADGTHCQHMEWPCEPVNGLNPSPTTMPLNTMWSKGWTSDEQTARFRTNAMLTRNMLDSMSWELVADRCFPITNHRHLDAIVDLIDSSLFEQEKCALIKSNCLECCLTADQVERLLLLIASEDRRLQILTFLAERSASLKALPIHELFSMRFMREKAAHCIRNNP